MHQHLILVCAWCGRTKAGDGSWQSDHHHAVKNALTTHGICPDCSQRSDMVTF